MDVCVEIFYPVFGLGPVHDHVESDDGRFGHSSNRAISCRMFGVNSRAARALTGALFVTGALELAYWIVFCTVGMAPARPPACYFAYEHSFLVPDVIVALTMLATAVLRVRGHELAPAARHEPRRSIQLRRRPRSQAVFEGCENWR